jgi:alanine racemase
VNDWQPTELGLASSRATRALVRLDEIAENVRVFRRLIGPSVKLMAVVKANGYGHGAIMVAKTSIAEGADYLGVATVDEGIQLRNSGLTAPILVLGPVQPGEIAKATQFKLELAVGSAKAVSELAKAGAHCSPRKQVRIHLKIDTGMRRFGCLPEEIPEIAPKIASESSLELVGTFTHFASADEEAETPTLIQVSEFEQALDLLARSGLDPGLRHAANSAATLRSRRYDFDMVRIGISLYGIAPSLEIPLFEGLRPAMSIRTRVGRVMELAPRDRVSYGGTYEARRHERAALIPIGYADGFRRGLSGNAWVGIDGFRCPVLGRVCMDQTVVGVPAQLNVREGDEVVVVGDATQGAPSLDDLANITGTIAYEVASAISKRVPRIFLNGDELIAIEDLHGLREFV